MPNQRQATVHELRKPQTKGADKWEQLGQRESKGSLTWADAGAEDLLAAIAAATEDGAAVLLSKTSDGGALVIQVWNGAGRHKLYPASMAELNEALQLIQEIATAR
jgi:hypothetical protein